MLGGIVTEIFLNSGVSEREKLKQLFETTLKGIREEFDDHRETINDNTNEIQANYEYSSRIDEKLNKLLERLDNMESWMSRLTGLTVKEDDAPVIELTEHEKKVFLILYTASEEHPVTYGQIAEYLGDNDLVVRGYVTNLLEKGIPIQKLHVDRQVYLTLDHEFREKQAKRNILGINQRTVKEFLG